MSNTSPFVKELTSDPDEQEVLKRLLHALGNKYKVTLTSRKLPQHHREAVRATAVFLNRPQLIKSFHAIVMKKIRYMKPDDYAVWISDLNTHVDDALALRLKFKPTQTYKALSDYIAGLNKFTGAETLTPEQKSCLITASYVMNSPVGVIGDEEAFLYDWDNYYSRLADGDLVEYIIQNPDKALAIQSAITDYLVLRPAELESAITSDKAATLIKGTL